LSTAREGCTKKCNEHEQGAARVPKAAFGLFLVKPIGEILALFFDQIEDPMTFGPQTEG